MTLLGMDYTLTGVVKRSWLGAVYLHRPTGSFSYNGAHSICFMGAGTVVETAVFRLTAALVSFLFT